MINKVSSHAVIRDSKSSTGMHETRFRPTLFTNCVLRDGGGGAARPGGRGVESLVLSVIEMFFALSRWWVPHSDPRYSAA